MTNYPIITYKYTSTKEYIDAFPCAYRQYLTDSHCQNLHGYSFSMKFYFGANTLDVRNFVADYGGLKELKSILEDQFDHTLLVSETDPNLDWYKEAEKRGMAKITILPKLAGEVPSLNIYPNLAFLVLLAEQYDVARSVAITKYSCRVLTL